MGPLTFPSSVVVQGASYKFSCHSSRGAIAVLGDAGHQKWYISNRQFRQYIAKHHASWCDFAEEKGYEVPADAIVLVSGWLKTSEWAIATFSNEGKSHEISFNASAGSYASAAFEVSAAKEVQMSVEQRCGPPQDDRAQHTVSESLQGHLPHNQCLFLRYYKYKSRALLRPRAKILVQAEAKDVQGPWYDSASSSYHHSRSSAGGSSSGAEGSVSSLSWFARLTGH